MINHKNFFWIVFTLFLVFSSLSIRAQEPTSPAPPKYRMELVYIFEEDKTEFIFVIGNVGFKSVAAMKKFIGRLPPGTVLEWAPGCERLGGEPLLSSEQDMKKFKAFCETNKVKFVLIPAG